MKLKYTGETEMTLRHMTFTPGKAEVFNMDDPADAALAAKCIALPVFEEVKPGRKPKADDQDAA